MVEVSHLQDVWLLMLEDGAGLEAGRRLQEDS
jgi:hypothetical protein